MSLPVNRIQREHNKFTEDKDGNVAVRTIPSSGQSINPLALYLERTLTNSVTETYEYYESASKAILYNTVVVVYTDSTLDTILNVTWS